MTRLYLHNAASTVSGTLPTAEQSTRTSTGNYEAQTINHSMDTTKGTSQASLSFVRSAASTADPDFYVAKFVSPPLSGVTSITANTWTWNFSVKASDVSSSTGVRDYPGNGTNDRIPVTCYVWRPSTGTKIGNILDGDTANQYYDVGSFSDQTPTTAQVAEHGTFSGSLVSSVQNGDVIVLEAWVTLDTNSSSSVTVSFYYDGTTETTTGGTTVSNHAAFLDTPQTLTFAGGGGGGGGTGELLFYTDTFTSRTGTGTDVISGVGFQPKAIILWTTGFALADDTFGNNYGFRFGGAVDTTAGNQRSFDEFSSDNKADSTTQTGWRNAAYSSNDAAIMASVSAIGSDGFTLNWTANDTTAKNLNFICIGGADITNTKSGDFTGPTATGSQSITGIGFKPDLVIFFGIDTTTNSFSGTTVNWGIGFGINPTSGSKQACLCGVSKEAAATSDCKTYQRADNTAVYALLSGSSTTTKALEGSLTSLDTDGWTINWGTVGITSRKIGYVAIKGGSYFLKTVTAPTTGTSPVSQAHTGFGFGPTGIIMAGRGRVTGTTAGADNKISFGAAASSSVVRCAYAGDLDAQGTTVSRREQRGTKIAQNSTISGTPSITAEAGVTSLDSDGATLSWSVHDTSAYEYILLGLGPGKVQQNITKSLSATVTIVANPPARVEGHVRTLSRPITIVANTPTKQETHVRTLTRPITIVASLARIEGHFRTLTRPILITAAAPIRFKAKPRTISQTVLMVPTLPTRLIGKTRTLTRPILIVESKTRLLTMFRSLSRSILVSTPLNTSRIAGKKKVVPAVTVSILAQTLTRLKDRRVSRTAVITIVQTAFKRQGGRARTVPPATVTTSSILTRTEKHPRVLSALINITGSTTQLSSRLRIRTLSSTIHIVQTSLLRLAGKQKSLSRPVIIGTPTLVVTRAKSRSVSRPVTVTANLNKIVSHLKARTLSQTVIVSSILTRLVAKTRTRTAILQVSEFKNRLKSRRISNSQTLGIIGQTGRLSNKVRTRSAVLSIITLGKFSRTKNRSLTPQTLGISESESLQRKKIRTIHDTVLAQDIGHDFRILIGGIQRIIKTITEGSIHIFQLTGKRTVGKWRRIGG